MSIVTLRGMLQDARCGRYAIPLPDVQNMGMIRAAGEVAEEEKVPVIIAKINICSELMSAWNRAASAELYTAPNDSIQNIAVCRPAEEAVREVTRAKIRLFGCSERRRRA